MTFHQLSIDEFEDKLESVRRFWDHNKKVAHSKRAAPDELYSDMTFIFEREDGYNLACTTEGVSDIVNMWDWTDSYGKSTKHPYL